jgi:hypothetical protein
MQHRCGERRSVLIPVDVRIRGSGASAGVVSNISESGALIRSASPVRPHSLVFVKFPVADEPGARAVAAEVVRRTATGFAVEWLEFAPDPIRCVFLRSGETVTQRMSPGNQGSSWRA